MKLPWQKLRLTNEANISWVEWRYIRDGIRCARLGRVYWSVTQGTGWERQEPNGKIVKLIFEKERIVDIKLPSHRLADIERYLYFAMQCVRDSDEPIDVTTPVAKLCDRRLEHMICNVRYYEEIHPDFGRHFRGRSPDVSVALLAAMVVDALQSKSVRLTEAAWKKVLRGG